MFRASGFDFVLLSEAAPLPAKQGLGRGGVRGFVSWNYMFLLQALKGDSRVDIQVRSGL